MESYARGQTTIMYEREGDGPPILLLAPGGMRSANNFWNNMPWNPREKLQDQFVAVCERNCWQLTRLGPHTDLVKSFKINLWLFVNEIAGN